MSPAARRLLSGVLILNLIFLFSSSISGMLRALVITLILGSNLSLRWCMIMPLQLALLMCWHHLHIMLYHALVSIDIAMHHICLAVNYICGPIRMVAIILYPVWKIVVFTMGRVALAWVHRVDKLYVLVMGHCLGCVAWHLSGTQYTSARWYGVYTGSIATAIRNLCSTCIILRHGFLIRLSMIVVEIFIIKEIHILIISNLFLIIAITVIAFWFCALLGSCFPQLLRHLRKLLWSRHVLQLTWVSRIVLPKSLMWIRSLQGNDVCKVRASPLLAALLSVSTVRLDPLHQGRLKDMELDAARLLLAAAELLMLHRRLQLLIFCCIHLLK